LTENSGWLLKIGGKYNTMAAEEQEAVVEAGEDILK